MNDFHADDLGIEEFLNDPAGPVGTLLFELATEGALAAEILAPVRVGNVWNELTTTARPPGFTKATIHPHMGFSRAHKLYASFNAAADPTIFLEKPAEQLHFPRPFMTTALWSITFV